MLNWFIQVTMAVKHIHGRNILHRDLKSQNVFLTSQGIVKLGDFGIAKVLTNTTDFCNTMVGTPYNMSPELCEDKPYNKKSDVWSLGCLLYEMCSLKHAFNGKSLPALILKIMRGRYPPIPDIYSDHLQKLVKALLSTKPTNRPMVSEILALPFIKQCIKDIVAFNPTRAATESSTRPRTASQGKPPSRLTVRRNAARCTMPVLIFPRPRPSPPPPPLLKAPPKAKPPGTRAPSPCFSWGEHLLVVAVWYPVSQSTIHSVLD